MGNQKNSFAASVHPKNGRLYAVIQVKQGDKHKSVWRALNLPEDASKVKIQKALRDVVGRFEDEYENNVSEISRPIVETRIFDYMCLFLKEAEPNLQINTYRSYHNMIYGKIQRYFTSHEELTVGNITPEDIKDFYKYLSGGNVAANTVIHYHAVLHRAFVKAFDEKIINANPFDRVERPKKDKFIGKNYSEEELLRLLETAKTDPIYPAIVLAGCLGLRRSEALGIRWSRIDWKYKTVLLDTKIIEHDKEGRKAVIPVEEMKNSSSCRTLPLPDQVFDMLTSLRESQEMNRKMFGKSYNHDFDDYVCVTQLGDLFRPSYVTQHFTIILRNNNLRRIRFHDLRHTFASILINQEVPLINISKFLGHSDIATTANIYAHLDNTGKQISADVMSGILNQKK